MHFASGASALEAFSAFRAEPCTIGALSPSNLYLLSRSRSSTSTSSIISAPSLPSGSMSILFRNTTIAGMPTWRPSRMCSRVCGIGPSGALTTRIAPSICAAPVIMFLM